jgi:hypothetical protein
LESASGSLADIDKPQLKSIDLNKLAIENEVCSPFVPAKLLTFCGGALRHEGAELREATA